MHAQDISNELKRMSSPRRRKSALRFFKTAPGQYGHGDKFLGVSVPESRKVATKYQALPVAQIQRLLKSPLHEVRLVGLLILVSKYKNAKTESERKQFVAKYLSLRRGINNWDLVDGSAAHILGDYLQRKNQPQLLLSLSKSKRHWDRRIAIVSTFAFTRNQQTDVTFKLASCFLRDREDLMHKATGWMLREAGKRDLKGLKKFLAAHGKQMPRTMLRYSIEKFPEHERKKILLRTRKPGVR